MRNLRNDLEICEKATPGPWIQEKVQDGELFPDGTGYAGDFEPVNSVVTWIPNGEDADIETVVDWTLTINDAQFIAEAREGWPEAIRRALKAEARVNALQEVLDDLLALIDEGIACRDNGDGAYIGNAVDPECDEVKLAVRVLNDDIDPAEFDRIQRLGRVAEVAREVVINYKGGWVQVLELAKAVAALDGAPIPPEGSDV